MLSSGGLGAKSVLHSPGKDQTQPQTALVKQTSSWFPAANQASPERQKLAVYQTGLAIPPPQSCSAESTEAEPGLSAAAVPSSGFCIFCCSATTQQGLRRWSHDPFLTHLSYAEEGNHTLQELQACSGLCSPAISVHKQSWYWSLQARASKLGNSWRAYTPVLRVLGVSLLKITAFAEVGGSTQGFFVLKSSCHTPRKGKSITIKEKQYAEAAAQLHYFILYIYTKVKWIFETWVQSELLENGVERKRMHFIARVTMGKPNHAATGTSELNNTWKHFSTLAPRHCPMCRWAQQHKGLGITVQDCCFCVTKCNTDLSSSFQMDCANGDKLSSKITWKLQRLLGYAHKRSLGLQGSTM